MTEQLPTSFVDKLNKSVGIDTTKFKSPISAILEERKKNKSEDSPSETPEPVRVVEIDGYVLPADTNTLLMYILATELCKNPRVKKIVDTFGLSFPDANGTIVYPKTDIKKKVRRIRKKSKRKTK